MDVDDTVLVDMYGLSSDLVKDYAIFMPAMNVHATEIILVEAQDEMCIRDSLEDDLGHFQLELTELKDRKEKYDLGECEFHLALTCLLYTSRCV